jgi:hypothetical protein
MSAGGRIQIRGPGRDLCPPGAESRENDGFAVGAIIRLRQRPVRRKLELPDSSVRNIFIVKKMYVESSSSMERLGLISPLLVC